MGNKGRPKGGGTESEAGWSTWAMGGEQRAFICKFIL
jgi:hypothetical protein